MNDSSSEHSMCSVVVLSNSQSNTMLSVLCLELSILDFKSLKLLRLIFPSIPSWFHLSSVLCSVFHLFSLNGKRGSCHLISRSGTLLIGKMHSLLYIRVREIDSFDLFWNLQNSAICLLFISNLKTISTDGRINVQKSIVFSLWWGGYSEDVSAGPKYIYSNNGRNSCWWEDLSISQEWSPKRKLSRNS